MFHIICHQENCSYEHVFQLIGLLKASMEPQDQAQITFRSEIHSIVFTVGQEVDCLRDGFKIKTSKTPSLECTLECS